MSTRELIENYTAYTDALEMSHSAAADTTARTTPFCTITFPGTFLVLPEVSAF